MKWEFAETLIVLNVTEILYACEQRIWIQGNLIQTLCKRLTEQTFICMEMCCMNSDKTKKCKKQNIFMIVVSKLILCIFLRYMPVVDSLHCSPVWFCSIFQSTFSEHRLSGVENSCLLGCDALQFVTPFSSFQRNLVHPSSG